MCIICGDEGWVCENHPDRSWETGNPTDCNCGGAGMPCKCNAMAAVPPGMQVIESVGPVEHYKPTTH